MSIQLVEKTARDLEAALTAESVALERGELQRAAELSTGKMGALEAFLAARQALGTQPMAAVAPRLALPIDRLRKATERNRKALERGIALQSRVVEAIARAAGQPAVATPGYAKPAKSDAAPLAMTFRA
jgi:flagellar biosynthesis/type III secretory pathway chaperone